MVKFITLSDLHYGWKPTKKDEKFTNTQQNTVKRVVEYLKTNKDVDFVSIIGDLTHMGTLDQLTLLKNNCITPIQALTKLFLINGGHDDLFNPVMQYICKNYTSDPSEKLSYWFYPEQTMTSILKTAYSRIIDGVYFFMLGNYPNKEMCDYFQMKVKQLNLTTQPIVLMFHHATDGYYSEKCWTKDERDYFYSCIKNYNVLAIYSGHEHQDVVKNFNGIPDILAAYNKFCLSEIKDGKLTYKYL